MEKHQLLQKKINEILYPELQDRLLQGCELIADCYGIITLSKKAEILHDGKWIDAYGFDHTDGFPRSVKGKDVIQVLGYPLTLELLMHALSKNNKPFEIQHLNIHKHMSFKVYVPEEQFEFDWGIHIPFYKQYQGTQDKIYKLFEIENG